MLLAHDLGAYWPCLVMESFIFLYSCPLCSCHLYWLHLKRHRYLSWGCPCCNMSGYTLFSSGDCRYVLIYWCNSRKGRDFIQSPTLKALLWDEASLVLVPVLVLLLLAWELGEVESSSCAFCAMYSLNISRFSCISSVCVSILTVVTCPLYSII